jgi:hypothetical protein
MPRESSATPSIRPIIIAALDGSTPSSSAIAIPRRGPGSPVESVAYGMDATIDYLEPEENASDSVRDVSALRRAEYERR